MYIEVGWKRKVYKICLREAQSQMSFGSLWLMAGEIVSHSRIGKTGCYVLLEIWQLKKENH